MNKALQRAIGSVHALNRALSPMEEEIGDVKDSLEAGCAQVFAQAVTTHAAFRTLVHHMDKLQRMLIEEDER